MSQRKLTSYPKEKINILLLENISDAAVAEFKEAGYINTRKLSGALSEQELIKEVKEAHLLGIRSKTQITANVLAAAKKLQGIGCFCIGTNQVDLKTATEQGVAVFNAPYSNTRSVAELVIGLSVMLIRRIPDKNVAAHKGIWMKEATGSFELRGKTMAIVGYGSIGTQVSVLAEAMGMKVLYYDVETKLPIGNAEQVRSLKELFSKADIITLHVPSNKSTENMINKETLQYAKKGAIFLNYARGEVVELNDLKEALESGHLSGAAIDVFPVEPEKNGAAFATPLQLLPNVILTPHIGGSTEEAQHNIGLDVSSKMLNYLEKGASFGSHTIPALSVPPVDNTHRILHIHKNVPGVLSDINRELSSRHINILGQYLKTNDQIGYVVLDVDSKLSQEAFALLKEVNHTIKTRMLY
ncbi:phosphoglycerate dehydrogenase [Chitinophaga sp. SYP-B3965]|uniref:phosphoglycerate dehydrogenase n=1 Tax=Chitinophaga sp. SYP-B3965 TaxID=2663120 RepID=UPI00129993CE|nr:phosphoglycerate dehydrogenase [Chitinophaga sp. SYP-B3965]MRG44415.1 phosphoglycerate dehydrogenase [Chitinophaga sp. SYP-B3965]